LPFDEFTIEQLAGDLLPNATRDQLIATGFHRNTMVNEEGGIDPLEYRFYSVVDRVHVTATSWLGLTLACAQCHTHKYDPIPHAEYYQFLAFLNNADEPLLPIPEIAVAEQRLKTEREISALESPLPDQFPVEVRIAWQTPGVAVFVARSGAEAEFLSDGTFRIGATKADRDTYTIKFEAGAQRITHLQLEAIPDEKVGKGGPGYGDAGNFVLSELELEIPPVGNAGAPRKIKYSTDTADYAQEGIPGKKAIDGNLDTGWAIGGKGENLKHRHAVFELAEPLEL
jgi:hypothetical protein